MEQVKHKWNISILKSEVSIMTAKERTELKKFLEYIQDKVEACYKKETENTIKDYLKDIKIVEVK